MCLLALISFKVAALRKAANALRGGMPLVSHTASRASKPEHAIVVCVFSSLLFYLGACLEPGGELVRADVLLARARLTLEQALVLALLLTRRALQVPTIVAKINTQN